MRNGYLRDANFHFPAKTGDKMGSEKGRKSEWKKEGILDRVLIHFWGSFGPRGVSDLVQLGWDGKRVDSS